jgi:hypothetical protein
MQRRLADIMIYLLDANTLIDAKRDYFEFERVPEFWEWLKSHGSKGGGNKRDCARNGKTD